MKFLELMMFKISKISEDKLTWENASDNKIRKYCKNVLFIYISQIKCLSYI